MKKIAILLSLIISVSAQTTIDSLKASKVDRNIITLSQSTRDYLNLNGLHFWINQYYNLSDWNNDGLGDLVIMIGYNEEINDDDYLSLFLQKRTGDKVEFIEEPDYLMNIQGHVQDWENSVGDVNGDSFLDIFVGTSNYHGPAGSQPSYYIGNNETTDKLFLNTGQGFTRLELDTTTTYLLKGVRDYWPTNGTIMLDWDFDGKLEMLVSDHGYQRVREGQNPVKDKLFSSFEIDANNKITREFVFDWPLDDEFIETQVQFLSVINDTLYLAHRVRKGWDIDNSIFVDKNNVNSQSIIWHSDQEVLIIDMKKSFGKAGLIKRITLDRKDKGGDMNYQDGFHLADIDNDGKLEYITAYWYESKDKQVPFIKIYDDDGTDITDTWLGDNYMDTSKKHGGNGVNVVDLNNDGYIDIIPRDGWSYYMDSHSPNKYNFTDKTRGTFGIFLNDGTKFNQYNIDFSHLDIDDKSVTYLRSGSRLYTKEPVDFDNDGLYEFLIRFDRGDGNANMDIVTINYKNNIEDISDLSIKEDSIKVIKLPGADLKGGTISYSAKSSENNVTATVSNDTLTLTPALNWHGTAQITAYASGSSWKDSTTFSLTVTPVNDAPVITAVADDSTNEETEKALKLSTTDVDGDALTYSASSDTSAVGLTISSDTLKLNPALNYTGTAKITVIVSDNKLTDTTSFTFKVINVNDAPVMTAVANDTTSEDSDGKAVILSASDIEGDALTYSAVSDTTGLTVTISNDTLRLKPVADYFGTSSVKAFVSDGQLKDSTAFSFTVLNVQDAPYAFDWVSAASDSINITQSNLTDTYDLKWNTSNEVDGETIDYLISASVGQFPAEMIHDTTDTSMTITYQDIIDHWYPNLAMLPRATLKFSVSATDGIDTVNVTGDDRVLFVNRYEFLSTEGEGIPTEFALHENYPNPFNPTTTLRFDLPQVSDVTVTIFNMLGQSVRTFNMNNTPAGYHSIKWNATNDFGEQVGAGVYLYQLRAKQFVKTRKMVLLK